ncbi:hypothetical protein Tco_0013530 [Tanacetum coccineum]
MVIRILAGQVIGFAAMADLSLMGMLLFPEKPNAIPCRSIFETENLESVQSLRLLVFVTMVKQISQRKLINIIMCGRGTPHGQKQDDPEPPVQISIESESHLTGLEDELKSYEDHLKSLFSSQKKCAEVDENGPFLNTKSQPTNEKVNGVSKDKPAKYKKVYSRRNLKVSQKDAGKKYRSKRVFRSMKLKDVIPMGDLKKKKKAKETSKSSSLPSRSELGVSDSESNLKRLRWGERVEDVALESDDSSKEVSEEVNQTMAVGNSIGFSMKEATKECKEKLDKGD